MRLFCIVMLFAASACAQKSGLFDAIADIGNPTHKASVQYDESTKTYRITASGHNMWANTDGFSMLYKTLEGDVTLTASVDWLGEGKNAHRKAGPIFRASLDADAPYADFIFHGSGELSMQYRKVKGGLTAEIKTALKPPLIARLARHGSVISAEVAKPGGAFQPVGALTIEMPPAIYVGLAACSHDNTVSETALLKDVSLEHRGVVSEKERIVESTLEIIDIDTGLRTIVRRAREHFEAPNWSRDGSYLLYNSGGKLYRIASTGGEPKLVDTGERIRCNNDHGLSPDGKWLAISDGSANRQSQIYVLPSEGGTPRLLTKDFPSYWHGWSPDGRTLAYCARRNNEFDIYTIPVDGGEEKRLTTAPGLDDGPDYSPDGRYIFFNSVRSGVMRIWRMNADGTEQQMHIQGDDSADWFAHPSPDSKWLAYVSFDKSVEGHPPNKDVTLKIAPMEGGRPRVIATLFGGQGTINVPSWAPDSKRFAFVSYRLVGK